MSVTDSQASGPVIAMPKKTPAGLRAAVIRLNPEALKAFDDEWASAMEQGREEYSLLPARYFIEHWWSWVGLKRWPERARRVRECERIVATSEDRSARRSASAEIARILADSSADADAGR